MNQRISSILQTLKGGDTTINALAEQFQVSPRTIRNDLKEVGRLLRQNDLPDLSLQSGGRGCPAGKFQRISPRPAAGGPLCL